MAKKYTNVYQDKNENYFFQVYLGTDPVTGKKISKKGRTDKTGKPFETAKEAYDEMLRVKVEFNTKHSYDNYSITFEQFMNEIYLKAYRQKVQFATYQTALTQHNMFIERFRNRKLREITTRDCEMFRLFIVDKFSENYARSVWSRFKACMGYAERLGYISEYPCKNLDNPRGKHPETKFWTYDDFQKVMKTFDLSDYEGLQRFTMVWLYYMTGCRVSEGFSLKWSDINFKEKILHVHSTLEKDENGIWYSKQQTKTAAGMRFIELDDITLQILKQWREVQVQSSSDDYIISRFGEPIHKSTLSRVIKRHAQIAEVPVITGKGLRHSHASYLINVLRKNTLYVSYRLGHADKSTTLNTYSHWYHHQDESISDEITRNIKKAGLDLVSANNSAKEQK
ncbi:site-specific integrase [Lactococcus sp. S47]|uniref:tyrosine-type recombinase/integrase n=1 Tax=Lactococcus sp. S47 TaxID=2767460 RepID=UPI001902DE1E|nr:site-specific integrase [Lactococcus sp. S47]MBK0028819.1 site-specific integrase [Lactococcus sp. S47]